MRSSVNRERSQNGKVRFRVVEIEVEGNDSSLGETMRSIQAALMRPAQNGARSLTARSFRSLSGRSDERTRQTACPSHRCGLPT